LASNVTHAPLEPVPAASRLPGAVVDPRHDPKDANGRSNVAVKYTVCSSRPAQNPPALTRPSTVRSPTTCTSESNTFWLALPVLNRMLAAPVAGNVCRCHPVRVVAVNSEFTPYFDRPTR
jgi:hypothetical protein